MTSTEDIVSVQSLKTGPVFNTIKGHIAYVETGLRRQVKVMPQFVRHAPVDPVRVDNVLPAVARADKDGVPGQEPIVHRRIGPHGDEATVEGDAIYQIGHGFVLFIEIAYVGHWVVEVCVVFCVYVEGNMATSQISAGQRACLCQCEIIAPHSARTRRSRVEWIGFSQRAGDLGPGGFAGDKAHRHLRPALCATQALG